MISLIIPTLNAERYLKDLFCAFDAQTRRPDEFIVIDSSSEDNTVRMAQAFGAQVVSIPKRSFDHGGTRNIAARRASGDIIVFLTQDALPEDEFALENLLVPLQHPDIAAAYGRQIAGSDADPPERFVRHFNYPPSPCIKEKAAIPRLGIKTFFFSNVFSAIKRKEFEELDGFPQKTIINEDMIFAARLILKGHKIAYASDARVIHSHNYSFRQVLNRYFDIGVALKDNPWILENAKLDHEGARFLKEEFDYLLKNGFYAWLPDIFLDAISKYLGYKLGLNYTRIPNFLRKKLSLHKLYW